MKADFAICLAMVCLDSARVYSSNVIGYKLDFSCCAMAMPIRMVFADRLSHLIIKMTDDTEISDSVPSPEA